MAIRLDYVLKETGSNLARNFTLTFAAILGFTARREKHNPGHSTEGKASRDPLKRLSALRAFAQVMNSQHRNPPLNRQIGQGLKAAPSFGVVVTIAGNCTHKRVNHYQRRALHCGYSLAQFGHVLCRIEGPLAAILRNASDEMHPRQIGTGTHQARLERIGNIILAAPDQHVTRLRHGAIRPAPAACNDARQIKRKRGFPGAGITAENMDFRPRQPSIPKPSNRLAFHLIGTKEHYARALERDFPHASRTHGGFRIMFRAHAAISRARSSKSPCGGANIRASRPASRHWRAHCRAASMPAES
jgi:hypothetical protein